MADLFVSYASEDRKYVETLVSEFERQGWSVWWDHHIETGSSFDRRIEDALDAARCVVVVWSETSVVSDWVRAEAAEGLSRNILIPILLDDVKPPLLFRQKQAVSLVDWKNSGASSADSLARLMPSIATILQAYEESEIPVSNQRAWVMGKVVGADSDSELTHACQVALSQGLSFLENLFLYEASFDETQVDELDPEQLQKLVDDEGLDGYLYGELSPVEDGIRISVTAQAMRVDTATIVSRTIALADDSVAAIADIVIEIAETLQGYPTQFADDMRVYLSKLSMQSLALYHRSTELARNNDYEAVKANCYEVLAGSPDFWLAHRALAIACIYLGQEREARESMVKAITAIDLESQKTQHFARGVYYATHSQDYVKAGEEFAAMLKYSPLDISAINNLAVCRYYQLDFATARELAARDLQLYPNKLLSQQNAAFFALYDNDPETADALAADIMAKNNFFASSVMVRALVAAYRGDIQGADDLYAQAFGEHESNDALLLQGRADLALGGDSEQPGEFLEQGVALDIAHENLEHHARKLLMMCELADDAEVSAQLEAALSVSSSTANLLATAVFCAERGIAPPALALRESKRTATAQGRACARMLEALVAYADGDLGGAVDAFDRARQELDLWLVHYCLAQVYASFNMPLEAGDEARVCLERFGEGLCATLDEQPSFRYFVRARRLLEGV